MLDLLELAKLLELLKLPNSSSDGLKTDGCKIKELLDKELILLLDIIEITGATNTLVSPSSLIVNILPPTKYAFPIFYPTL